MGFGRLVVRVALCGLTVLAVPAARAQTTGTVFGTVQDASTGDPLGGALVIAQSPALQGEQTALTSEEGTFRITLLPPGEYALLVQADGYRPLERGGIDVAIDKTVRVTLQVVPDSLRAEDVVVTTAAPVIDQGSTTSGAVIPEEFHEYIPTGRDFSAVLNVAPGATTDGLGTTFRGASSPENVWIIDGVNTTEISNAARWQNDATPSTRMPNDFIKQVEVKTGGYEAEYGRATGGVVNVVTKSGGNAFHGDVFVNFSSAALTAESRELETAASVVRAESRQALDMDFGFDLGGYVIKDKLWFFVGATPFFDRIDYTRRVTPVVGAEPSGDPVYGEPVPELTRELENTARVLTRLAKLTYNVSENHSLQVSYFADPTHVEGVMDTTLNGTVGAISRNDDYGNQNATARWSGKLFDKSMLVEAWYGLSYQWDSQLPVGDWEEGEVATVHRYAYVPDEFRAVCGDACENYASFDYFTGPYWFMLDNRAVRHAANLELTNFLSLAGEHALKYGGDVELNAFDMRRGYENLFAQVDFGPESLETRGYRYRRQALGRFDESGAFVPQELLLSDTETRNTALFVQDAWRPVDNLTLNLGVRWETQRIVGHGTDRAAITLDDNVAPRLGAVYDWTGVGRSKIEAYYGRFYESVPLDINARAFGQEGFGLQLLGGDGENLTPAFFGEEYLVLGGEDALVVRNLQGQYVDEYSAGVEYEVVPDLALGVSLVHREIGRIIEDVSPDDGQTYIIANVGDESQIDSALEEIGDDLAALGVEVDDLLAPDLAAETACVGADDAEACSALVQEALLTRGVYQFPDPRRDYDAVELMVRKNFSNDWYLIGSLTFSRTLGNYPGLFAPENVQLDPNITTQYDVPSLLANRIGPLRNDRPVYLKLDGYYLWDFGLVTGAGFRLFSGRPIDALATHPIYGGLNAFVLPRGEGGRTPTLYNLDLMVGYDIRLGEDLKVNLNANVFNVFNVQRAENVDHAYTFQEVNPVVGGDLSDIQDAEGNPTILDVYGNPVERNPDWRDPVALIQLQPPLQVRLGMRVSF